MNRIYSHIVLLILLAVRSCVLFPQTGASEIQNSYLLDNLPDSVQIIKLKELALENSRRSLRVSEDYANKRMILARNLNDPIIVGDSYNLLGFVNYSARLYENALQEYLRAQSMYDSIGYIDGLVETSLNIGKTYFDLGDTASCLKYYRRSVEYRYETGDNNKIADGLTTLGEAYFSYGDYEKSLSNLFQAVEYYGDTVRNKRKTDALALIVDNLLKVSTEKALNWIRILENDVKNYNPNIYTNLVNYKYCCYYFLTGSYTKASDLINKINFDTLILTEYESPVLFLQKMSSDLRKAGFDKEGLKSSLIARDIFDKLEFDLVSKNINSIRSRLDLTSGQEEFQRNQEINDIILDRIRTDLIIKRIVILLFTLLGMLLLYIVYNTIAIAKSSRVIETRIIELEEANKIFLRYKKGIVNTRLNKKALVSVIVNKMSEPFTDLCSEIESAAGLILSTTRGRDELRKAYVSIQKNARMLESKLQRVLLWSKLQRKRYETEIQLFNLNEFLYENLPEFLRITLNKGIRIRFDVSEDIIISFDKDALRKILIELINNSIEYSTSKDDIIIRGYIIAGEIELSIKDSSREIPSNLSEELFSINSSLRNEFVGSNYGLGLLIAKELAEINNSYITFESVVGKGNTFIIHIKKQYGTEKNII